MNNLQPTPPARSMVQRAASSGLYLGAYLSVLALLTGVSQQFPLAGLVVWVTSLALPFFVYVLQRNTYAETGFSAPYTEVWTEGICTFFLGSAIQAVVVYASLRYLAPGYIAQSVATSIEFFEQQGTPVAAQWIETLQELQRNHLLPSPTDVTAQLMSMNIIGGAIISIFTSLILVSRYRDEDRQRRFLQKRFNTNDNNRL